MPSVPEQSWFQRAAEKMVREEKNLYAVAQELELALTSRECDNLSRTKAFQRVLWDERTKYHKELANDPNRNKNSLIGNMLLAAERLMGEGKYDKAAEVLFKLARIEGYVGAESQVTVIGSLSQEDIDKAKVEVRKKLQPINPLHGVSVN